MRSGAEGAPVRPPSESEGAVREERSEVLGRERQLASGRAGALKSPDPLERSGEVLREAAGPEPRRESRGESPRLGLAGARLEEESGRLRAPPSEPRPESTEGEYSREDRPLKLGEGELRPGEGKDGLVRGLTEGAELRGIELDPPRLGEEERLGAGALRPALELRPCTEGEPIEDPAERPAEEEPTERPTLPPDEEEGAPPRPRWAQADPSSATRPESNADQKRSWVRRSMANSLGARVSEGPSRRGSGGERSDGYCRR